MKSQPRSCHTRLNQHDGRAHVGDELIGVGGRDSFVAFCFDLLNQCFQLVRDSRDGYKACPLPNPVLRIVGACMFQVGLHRSSGYFFSPVVKHRT